MANINDKFIFNRVKEEMGKQIQKECSKIYPLSDNCMVRKVKILKKPKFDLTKLMELYKNAPEAEKTADKSENKLAQ
jgi:small subunit ribosomal protein S3Ae